MHRILRATLALALVTLAFGAGPATAQPQPTPQTIVTQVQLGVREAGKTYPLALNAANADCNEPLDFRFTSNAAWLKLPADPVVRGVATGQSRPLQATIDLTNMSPGRYQATVEVECENCGWFIFKSCKIDKQQIIFFLDVAPAGAQPQPPGGAQAGPMLSPRAIDPNDPNLPPAVAKRLKDAYDARDAAAGAKNPCEEELKKLADAAKAAQAAADDLNKQAADADKAAKEAAEKAKKAEQDRNAAGAAAKQAGKDATAAADAAAEAKATAENDPITENRKEAKEKAAAAAAAAAKAAAAADAAAKAQTALDEARKAADAAKAAAAKAPSEVERAAADKKAKDAQAALAKKQAECDKAAADAKAKAQAEVDKAEKAARDALRAHRLSLEEALKAAQDNADRCKCHLAKLIATQDLAIQALIKLGAITAAQKSELKLWADKLREISELLRMVPDCPYKKLVETALKAVTAALDMLDYAKPVFNAELIPGTRSHTLGGDDAATKTKDFLKNEGLTSDEISADDIYQQMKNYADPEPDSMKKFMDDLDKASKDCNAADVKLQNAKEDAAKAGK